MKVPCLLVLAILSTVTIGFADCGTPTDGLRFRAEMRSRIACERKKALGAPVSCEDLEATCAEQLDRVADLVFGPVGVVSSGEPGWRCQRTIASAARTYLQRRIRQLVKDAARQATGAQSLVRRIERRCSDPAGEVLPVIGGSCATSSSPFDETEVALCLRGALEEVAQEVTGRQLKPNILLVLTDDQRADTLWAMPLARTYLAKRGVEFTESFVSTALCCPDRASILTGLYAHNHGVQSNAGALVFDHEGDTIARQLQENAGYRTALLGKYMVNTGAALGTSVPPGWEEWQVFTENGADADGRLYYNYKLNENGSIQQYGSAPADYSTDVLGERAGTLMSQWRSDPWFIELSVYAPHPRAIAAPRHQGTFAGLPPHRPPNWMEADVSDKPLWISTQVVLVAFDPEEPAATDAERIAELESLLAVDEAVGALSEELEALGLTDNTLVVFTSDNGLAWLEHWLRLKNTAYEEIVRVPLLLRYPKLVHVPQQLSNFVQSIDFYPTFAELAGIAGQAVNGRSLVQLLRNDSSGWREDLLLEHFVGGWSDPSSALRTADWKLIETEASSGVTTELYDLNADPYEMSNVADDPVHASRIDQMRTRLAELLAE